MKMKTLVCAVSSPAGVGCGILATLKGAPCILVPFHVVGVPENAQKVRIAARVGGKVVNVSLRSPPSEGWQLSSPEPPSGRPPDVNRMDYVIAPCKLPGEIDRTHLVALEDCDESNGPGGEIVVVAAPASWLRSRAADEASIADETRTSGHVTSSSRDHAGVAMRYDARTASGVSGGAVFETRVDDEPRLVAMHRAGAASVYGDPDGECDGDAEGVHIADIMRDVAETVAENAVRDAASGGDLAAAAKELLRRPDSLTPGRGWRGRRCRAAAAALRAAAEHPERAARAAAVIMCTDDVNEGAHTLLIALDTWTEVFARSVRFADAAAHLAGSLARAGLGKNSDDFVDEFLVDALVKHTKVEAVVCKVLWALRLRTKRRGGVSSRLAESFESATLELRKARGGGEESSVHRELSMLDVLMASTPHRVA